MSAHQINYIKKGGQNLIHDLSFAGAGDLGSLELLTLTNEIAGMAKRSVRSLSTDDEAIALEVIEGVKHGGDYLREGHTFKHFREELMAPELIRRIGEDKWEDNFSVNRARELTKEKIDKSDVTPLPEEEDKQLNEIIEEARSMI